MRNRAILLFALVCVVMSDSDARRPIRILGPAGSATEPTPPRDLGGISIVTHPAPALVFIDGVFVGQTEKDKPIVITRETGKVELRATEAGFLDALADVVIEAGVMKDLDVTLADQKDKWSAPTTPIMLGVGQVFRGALPRPGSQVRFVVAETYVPERMFITLEGNLSFAVVGPDGKKVEVTNVPAEESQGRPPGRDYAQYEGSAAGSYTIVVSGSPGPFAFRFVQALRKPQASGDPNEPGRRAAPQPPRKN